MRVDIITIFPGFFETPLNFGMIRRAVDQKKLEVHCHDLRDYARDRVVDDYPYGGGAGMVLKAEPIIKAVMGLRKKDSRIVFFSPAGVRLTQDLLIKMSSWQHLILVCGRYKGVDHRAVELLKPVVVSIGDFVLSGGELGALIVIEGVARLLPGVLKDPDSARTDSFSCGILDGPYYTRPRVVRRRSVPRVLLSGDHQKIRDFRLKESLRRTWQMRPDLFGDRIMDRKELLLFLEVLHETARSEGGRSGNNLLQNR
ncbi:tRNA (guanosine(37)-N1)-methyltransferase TrmD [candidate division WOR-3 bacterium]|mgnify:CR=1 FL=1|uniref:tRNA (guanine-N(1)-)-methyltransferase n=1 Tax=candidate division WOR-3 bacterium TaxID=2052148 RepID=A0A660SFN4_UNCW3|nr:MAG: tRNA (guanosine(37)-N1)-methyltransferase TrmD [candidate division WOR-3 bacterium]